MGWKPVPYRGQLSIGLAIQELCTHETNQKLHENQAAGPLDLKPVQMRNQRADVESDPRKNQSSPFVTVIHLSRGK